MQTMITRWHYYIDPVMITRWRHCNNTEHALKIMTFNCHGFKSYVNDVLSLCKTYDIVFLQELWLFSEDLTLLKNVHKNFDAHAMCAMNDDQQLLVGRPF